MGVMVVALDAKKRVSIETVEGEPGGQGKEEAEADGLDEKDMMVARSMMILVHIDVDGMTFMMKDVRHGVTHVQILQIAALICRQ